MKKTFILQVENKADDRVVESIKHEIRKYIKREQRKPLPEGKDFWFFDCKFAKEEETPQDIPFSDIIKCINEAANEKCKTFYLEILSRAEKRPEKEVVGDIENIEELSSEDEIKED
ncbi:DUF6172 family protein [Halarcobacter ebronensis]|uniref:Uncharacterized protein n=1 Tax=Halarcobacter ebronensis TaxID=1462615 RepID=A0A4Q1AN90_9BACT|nr:DUF6172 family protein [Halarcobacter ebronensis]QKF81568.1 hypothetical protein AEBR_1072 [Halarcobacter ebronensis]RXK05496.1 hypothetical protein CRV07_08270 [Halarcobacter ebronensis]